MGWNFYTDGGEVVEAATTLDGYTSADFEKVSYRAVTEVVAAQSPYAVAFPTDIILTDSALGAVTVVLPSTHIAGNHVTVKDATGSASSNNVTVQTADADTIDGSASDYVISSNYGKATFVSNGTNWFVL